MPCELVNSRNPFAMAEKLAGKTEGGTNHISIFFYQTSKRNRIVNTAPNKV